jgi:hypothetical protein
MRGFYVRSPSENNRPTLKEDGEGMTRLSFRERVLTTSRHITRAAMLVSIIFAMAVRIDPTSTSVRVIDIDVSPYWLSTYVGRYVQTRHTKQVRTYKVVGVTDKPVSALNVHTSTMFKYYQDKHRIELKRLDLPAFECENSNTIPIELCYLELIPSGNPYARRELFSQ